MLCFLNTAYLHNQENSPAPVQLVIVESLLAGKSRLSFNFTTSQLHNIATIPHLPIPINSYSLYSQRSIQLVPAKNRRYPSLFSFCQVICIPSSNRIRPDVFLTPDSKYVQNNLNKHNSFNICASINQQL